MTLSEQLARNRAAYAALVAADSPSGWELPGSEPPRRRPPDSVGGREAATPPPVAASMAVPASGETVSPWFRISVPSGGEGDRGEEAAPAPVMKIAGVSLPAGEGAGGPVRPGPPGAAGDDDVYDAFLRRHETEARRQSQLLTEEEFG